MISSNNVELVGNLNNETRYSQFEIEVFNVLTLIPKGRVTTYLEVAKKLGRSKSSRAVANAIGKNPFAPKIPCHRVVRSDGKIGGYSGVGGVHAKKILLTSEGVDISNLKSYIYKLS